MLQFDKKILKEVQQLYESFIENDNYELECRFINIDKNLFYRGLNFLMIKLKPLINKEVLDINTDKERITLTRIDDMEKYQNKKFDDISNEYNAIHSKTLINKDNYNILDIFQARINLKEEKSKDIDHDKLIDILSDQQKIKKYRLKKRISFSDDKNRWRYDLTLVKSSNKFFNLIDQDISYEIEIEALNKNINSLKPFINSIYQLYAIIYNDIYPVTDSEKDNALLSIENFSKIKFVKNNFIGPKPITLERKNILMPKPGVITIQDDYAVTEKADGIRTILFIDNNGKSYLINNSKKVYYTGVSFLNIKGTIIDGEFVIKGKNNELIELFAIFDIYFYNEKNVSNYPLIDENNKNKDRLYYMKQFVKDCNNKFIFSLYLKPYKSGLNIFNVCSQIINSVEAPYKTDGLIFTPKNLPVGSNFKEEHSNLNGKTWFRNFKWKPEHLNTIDFLIKFSDTTIQLINTNSSKIQILNLYVAYNKFKNINCNYWIFTPINLIINEYYNYDNNTIEKLFIPPDEKEDICKSYIQIDNNNKIYTIEGQIIQNNSIVEFFYDDTKPDGYKWCPLKNRDDKTLIYHKENQIQNTANYWDTAINIWKTIKFPVSEDILTNEKYAYENIAIEPDYYYYDNYMPRDSYAIKNMNKFHNNVKRQLINDFCKNSHSLMDIACGKAGDLDKWISADIKKIYGIDLFKNNIEISDDSAYSRTLKRLLEDKKINLHHDKNTWVYFTIDASQKINESYSYKHTDKEVFDVLYGIKKNNEKKSNYWKYCVEPFDNISCQFAIHYFFKCSDSLDNFIYNVDKHLKSGGHFIGTCFDSTLIKKKLKTVDHIKGCYKNKTLWQINKKYNDDTLDFSYGETISVYIESVNQFIDEYLVNFDILEKKLLKYNIKVVGKYTNFKTYHDKSNINLDDVEKELSFLYVTFVFRKKLNWSNDYVEDE